MIEFIAGTMSNVNESYLNELMDGDEELLSELVSLFAQALSSYCQTLLAAAEQNDRPLFNQTAHKFRSSLNALAMLDTARKLKQLETDDTLDRLDKKIRLTDLFGEINQGLEFLQSRVNS